ncbi:MAG: hypothetical protein NVSMB12_05560 [Acidimicrobiales bacterium]
MPRSLKLLAAAAVTAIAIAGCSSSAKVTLGDGKGSPFCADVAKFQDQAHALEAAAGGDLAGLRTQADATRDQLVALQKEANPADRVNGHAVKDDLQVAVDTYKALAGGLDSANASDPNAVTGVLASVKDKQGGAFTASSGRLDAYAKQACGIAVTGATTTTAPAPPSSAAPGSSATTLAPAGGPVAATTTTSTP